MPNDAVDMDSWASSACYPRRTFYPLSDGPSTRDHRITMAVFRLCSTCRSRSQAGFCHCTRRAMSDRPEPTFARLRYALGGDRPSQTARHRGSRIRVHGPRLDDKRTKGGISRAAPPGWRPGFTAYRLSCTSRACRQSEAAVKVHGVFPSDRGNPASSRGVQFR